ncbi:FAD-dependent monooxygenase [Streptomyces sp. NPDC051132]|uniref:FAD-dependent monooxygenase n=1 Tax=unclassified Streptomyces TaxID=2593676 RepID=UPI0034279B83
MTEHTGTNRATPGARGRRRARKAVIVGGGIGGLTTAIALRRVGIEAEVYERAAEFRAAGSALSVMSNAVTALDTLGIDLHLDKYGQRIRRFQIRSGRGTLIRTLPFEEACRKAGAPSYCVSRAGLHQALLSAADCPIEMGAGAVAFEQHDDGVGVRLEDGRTAEGDVLIGADGFRSAVRGQLAGLDDVRDGGYLCWLGIVDFHHPRFVTGYVGHYWGDGQRFGLIDIGGGRAYWWGTKAMTLTDSAAWKGGKDDVARFYAGWAEEVREVIALTPDADIITVPAQDRPFLERWGTGRVTLLGDAAHPMLTSLGQGAAMAMEDAVVLAQSLATAEDPARGLRTYEDRRRERNRELVLASRTASNAQHSENFLRRLKRDTYYRTVPRRVLVERDAAVLSYPAPPLP